MEPTPSQKKEHILGNAGGFPERLVAEHCRRLDADYFNEFSVTEIEGHLARLATLSRSQPFAFQFSALQDRAFGLTVVGEDVPGFFAVLPGVLASHDLDIRVGKVFSYAAEVPEGRKDWAEERVPALGKIIDYLVLEKPEGAGFWTFNNFRR